MADKGSEERHLPPSRKKLREARKKGQVAKSKDLVSGAALAGALLYLLVAAPGILTRAGQMFEAAGQLATSDLHTGFATLGPALFTTAAWSLGPLFLIVPSAVIVSSIVSLGGIPFALDPIVPKPDKINPAEGFKKLFGLRSLVELVKNLFKTALIAAVLAAVLAGGLSALLYSPRCGLGCEVSVFANLARPVLIAAAALLVASGLADLGLQRWLFRRDQRMSITELKRERKDTDGDPHIRAERRKLMREALRLAGGLGLRRATVLIHDGGALSVGLRFKANEMPAPVVVCRARGERGTGMLAEARMAALPETEDAELARDLAKLPLGHGIPERLFRSVALALRRAGAV